MENKEIVIFRVLISDYLLQYTFGKMTAKVEQILPHPFQFLYFSSYPRRIKESEWAKQDSRWGGLLLCNIALNFILVTISLSIREASAEDFNLSFGIIFLGFIIGCSLLCIYYTKFHLFNQLNLGFSQQCHLMHNVLVPIALPPAKV